MIKFIVVDDEEKWINEFSRIINDVLFKSEKEYEIFTFKKYNNELKDLIMDNSQLKIYLMDLE